MVADSRTPSAPRLQQAARNVSPSLSRDKERTSPEAVRRSRDRTCKMAGDVIDKRRADLGKLLRGYHTDQRHLVSTFSLLDRVPFLNTSRLFYRNILFLGVVHPGGVNNLRVT